MHNKENQVSEDQTLLDTEAIPTSEEQKVIQSDEGNTVQKGENLEKKERGEDDLKIEDEAL